MKKLLKAVWGFSFVTTNVLLTLCGAFLSFVFFTDWSKKDTNTALVFLAVAVFAIGMLVLYFGIKASKPSVDVKKQKMVVREN